MRVLITGASGFLGVEMVRCALAQGHAVRAMIRPGSPRERVPLAEDDIFYADMTDFAKFDKALLGVNAVIHCAAVTSAGRTNALRSQRVNVEGTDRLFRAAAHAGVDRWIQISSMSAHPGSTSVYGRTKYQADQVLRRSMQGPEWVILRPSLIYGPGDRGLVSKTLQIARKLPFLPMIGSGEELLRPILAADVARAAMICLEHKQVAGRTYMVGGADEVSLNQFMRRLLEAGGLRRPLFHLPLWVCMIIARVGNLLLKNPPITVDNVLGVVQAQAVDIRFAQHDWGFEPGGLEEGLKATFP